MKLHASRMPVVSLVLLAAPVFVSAATWSTTDRFGSWNTGGFTLYNNVWAQSGYGPQTLWANSSGNWGVWSNQPNTGGIKSYPNVSKYVGKTISALTMLSTKFNVTTPAGGAWESTYDIWDKDKKYEIMLWMNYTGKSDGSGNVKPISYTYDATGRAVPVYTNVSVGGSTWNVFKGNNGNNMVFSFLRTTKTNGTTIDAKAILNWLKSKAWMGDVVLGDFQYGYEITSSSGGLNYVTNSYSLSIQ